MTHTVHSDHVTVRGRLNIRRSPHTLQCALHFTSYAKSTLLMRSMKTRLSFNCQCCRCGQRRISSSVCWPTSCMTDTARIVTVGRPSVRLSRHSTAARRCGGFVAVGPAGGRYRLIAARPAFAANASSITLSADVGS